MKKIIIFFFLVHIVGFAISNPNEALLLYKQGNLQYQKMDYNGAIKTYESIISKGTSSSQVYFNLGNSYFKSGFVPKAILNYERALKISPEDEDIKFNLKIASLKIIDRIDNVPEVFYERWYNHIVEFMPSNSWSTTFILSLWLMFISAAFYLLGRTSRIKKMSFILTSLFFLISIFTYTTAAHSKKMYHDDQQGIIMSASVYVKSSPDEKGNDLFILHEGTKVDILEKFENWNKIKIANGTIGWLKLNDLEKI